MIDDDSREINFSQISKIPRIKHLKIGQTVGCGSFAFVKKATLEEDPSVVVAVKFVHLPTCQKFGMAENDVLQEVVLQSKCSGHVNVLKVIDCNVSQNFLWIVMEMAEGGDLFDKIEPDVGVDVEVAQFYFQQLVRAVDYLHGACGVAHRDIKPENILLDKRGNLKLADFGLASKFRRKDGSKRICKDQRGSLVYMAPETVLSTGYFADATDIWSCGVLLFVLLTGEAPWEAPTHDSNQFQAFMNDGGRIDTGPWARINIEGLSILRKLLQFDSRHRPSAATIKTYPWFARKSAFADDNGMCSRPELLSRRLFDNLHVALNEDIASSHHESCPKPRQVLSTQPTHFDLVKLKVASPDLESFALTQAGFTQGLSDRLPSLTQEDSLFDYLNRDQATQQFMTHKGSVQNIFTIDRLTKFYSLSDMETIISQLEKAIKASGISGQNDLLKTFVALRNSPSGIQLKSPISVQLKTTDRKGWLLSGSIDIIQIDERLRVVGFERKRGDPLEWRRFFKTVVRFCKELIYIPTSMT
ncbi:LAMI_0H11496g1_1 [Lachancea mirantina]|uniref:non-specific serine/threonine protein kinase n=1 Tax=Lachancea mirantina TaxID=1230905 RepID=A0A1G4KHF2_9SACH|nr:LAMI_0H11496g1_1 [Lachancea mirantina]